MRWIFLFAFSLEFILGCKTESLFEESFLLYSSLEVEEICINRSRPDYYKENEVYEYWKGGNRTSFIKKINEYKVMHSENYAISKIDSLEFIFNNIKNTMDKFGILDICPTYRKNIVFNAQSKSLPNEIKRQLVHRDDEVIFYEGIHINSDTLVKKWNEKWSYLIVKIR